MAVSNRLSDESSPYLLQHADNPVDWHPWDAEALALARATNKPILLSVGYSACHWCHVMAHESFADEATAALMNEHFINIKVDREERPDLDKVYQLSLQLLTQQTGGWPLTMFLDPDTLLPFFGGTYFPNKARYQLPSFVDLLLRIREVFDSKRDDLNEQSARVAEVLGTLGAPSTSAHELEDGDLLAAARSQLLEQADSTDGGFGQAPKFPMPSTLSFLLDQWAFQQRRNSRPRDDNQRQTFDTVITSLTKLARGGIFDHLGGGFCRYSTDKQWMIPHFEKMLYDNGQLLSLFSDAFATAPDQLFADAITQTAHWLLREMRHDQGAFFASLDADSEGEEGKYYVWRRDQVKKLLSEDEYLVLETLYGLDKPANFEGKWNLHRFDAWRSVVERLSMQPTTANALLASGKAKLLAKRDQRERPALDNKILTSWNGLAIRGLAKAGSATGEPEWVDAAARAADFIRERLWEDGRLWATWQIGKGGVHGTAKHAGYLDDYANMLDGLLALLGARWRDTDADFALALAEATLAAFFDTEHGGFFFTANDHESLIHRPKPTMDDALPPGNGVMVRVLATLGHLFGQPRYLEAAHQTLNWARGAMEQYPAGHCSLLTGLQLELEPPELVVVRGPSADAPDWRSAANSGHAPWRGVYVIPYSAKTIPPYLPRLISADMQSRTNAYVCRELSCSLPLDSPRSLADALAKTL
jgi:uncharacterized protein YyaL (SSP411 family)